MASHLLRGRGAQAGLPALQPARGRAFGSAFGKEDGAAKAVLPSLGLEMHGLTFGFCLLDFKRAVSVCAQLARWRYANKKKA